MRSRKHSSSLHLATALAALLAISGCLPGALSKAEPTQTEGPAVTDLPAITATAEETLPAPAATPLPAEDCCPPHAPYGPAGFVQEGDLADIRDVWSSPSWQVYVSAESGVYTLQDGNWVQLWSGMAGEILGQDSLGNLWVISGEDAESVTAVSPAGGTTYGAVAGWLPFPSPDYLSPYRVDPLVSEPDGRVWLASGMDDLRTFDPQEGRWRILTHADLGFPDLAEEGYQGYFLSDVVLSGAGKVWAGACIGMGETLAGAGVSRLSDGKWQPIQHTVTEEACVFDMEVDGEGNAYVAAHDRMLTYKPATGNWWVMFYPGAGDPGRSLVTRIDLDPLEQPFIEVMNYTPVSPVGGFDYFGHDLPKGWQTLLEEQEPFPYELVFAPGGAAYMSRGARLYRWANLELEEMAYTGGSETRLAVDEAGTLYVMLPESGYGGLWKWTGETE